MILKRRQLIKSLSLSALTMNLPFSVWADVFGKSAFIEKKKFLPNWDSLSNYSTPDWFRDAKFGIWAHWGPQCVPENGDWYARNMYIEGHPQYEFHRKNYGHPSEYGFKDIIHNWKAENWDPQELVAFYKDSGAQYFMAMANHHDNLDLYDSKYQSEWNSLKIGPKKDIIGEWKKAAEKNNLPFGVSVHAAHAWMWYETSQRWDLTGKFKRIPYDGNLDEDSGKGQWWENMKIQDLYVQDHNLSKDSWDNSAIFNQWDWNNGANLPSKDFIKNVYQRTVDLVNKYDPKMIYFDDTVLPFWPIDKSGLQFLSNYYNSNLNINGLTDVVVTGKKLNDLQKSSMIWDIERGQSNQIEKEPWQTCTCIGDWHYNRERYLNNSYKSAQTVVHMLCDIVSKNGNLILNIPIRGDGSIDDLERKIVEDIGQWIKANGESIFGTRPWKIFGEGPAMDEVASLEDQGFNEGKNKPFTSADFRFTTKNDVLYAIAMGLPQDNKIRIKSLSKESKYYSTKIRNISLVQTGQNLKFKQKREFLEIILPSNFKASEYANSFRII